ncbi:MAG: sensor histidine kinase [Pirellulaceae bacterium]
MVEPNAIQLAHDVERLQADVAALRAERLILVRSLAHQEQDRQLTAYEIHDGIVQEMTASLLFLEGAGSQAEFVSDEFRQKYERGVRILRGAVEEARRLIGGLTPIDLDERGLTRSLERLVDKFRGDYGLAITYHSRVRFHRLAPAIELNLLRIAQEALHNVVKHSQSSRAEVRLVQKAGALELSVEDFGTGFDPAAVAPGHYGLKGIHERVRVLGGELTIDSRPGQGTRIAVRLAVIEDLLPPAFADRARGGLPTDP